MRVCRSDHDDDDDDDDSGSAASRSRERSSESDSACSRSTRDRNGTGSGSGRKSADDEGGTKTSPGTSLAGSARGEEELTPKGTSSHASDEQQVIDSVTGGTLPRGGKNYSTDHHSGGRSPEGKSRRWSKAHCAEELTLKGTTSQASDEQQEDIDSVTSGTPPRGNYSTDHQSGGRSPEGKSQRWSKADCAEELMLKATSSNASDEQQEDIDSVTSGTLPRGGKNDSTDHQAGCRSPERKSRRLWRWSKSHCSENSTRRCSVPGGAPGTIRRSTSKPEEEGQEDSFETSCQLGNGRGCQNAEEVSESLTATRKALSTESSLVVVGDSESLTATRKGLSPENSLIVVGGSESLTARRKGLRARSSLIVDGSEEAVTARRKGMSPEKSLVVVVDSESLTARIEGLRADSSPIVVGGAGGSVAPRPDLLPTPTPGLLPTPGPALSRGPQALANVACGGSRGGRRGLRLLRSNGHSRNNATVSRASRAGQANRGPRDRVPLPEPSRGLVVRSSGDEPDGAEAKVAASSGKPGDKPDGAEA